MSKDGPFYVYQFSDSAGVCYVGKGSGPRFAKQSRRFANMVGEIVRRFASERAAYAYEAALIARHSPSLNKIAGGGGAIARRKFRLPGWYRREARQIESVGSRRYVARALLRLIGEQNCEELGVSKVELNRVRQVANGPRL